MDRRQCRPTSGKPRVVVPVACYEQWMEQRLLLRSDINEAMLPKVLAHDAIAGRLIENGQLVAPFSHRAAMQEAYYLILSPQAEHSPGTVAFAAWLRAEMAADQSGLLGTQA